MSKAPTEYPGISEDRDLAFRGKVNIWHYYANETVAGTLWFDEGMQTYRSHSNRTRTTQTHPTFEAAYLALKMRA